MSKHAEPGVYRHFKGNRYRVLFTAKDSETETDVVVYVSMHNGGIWVRPTVMFTEVVKWPDGEKRPRFLAE